MINILKEILTPKVYSIYDESNIFSIYNKNILRTKDNNLFAGVKLNGFCYSNSTLEKMVDMSINRDSLFFSKIPTSIEYKIFIQKKKKHTHIEQNNSNLNLIINTWNENINNEFYEINYYIIFSTKKKNIATFLDTIKNVFTKEKDEEQEENSEEIFSIKKEILENLLKSTEEKLSYYEAKILTSDEILNFYSIFINGKEEKYKYDKNDFLAETYSNADIEFKKEYIKYNNFNDIILANMLSIKNYESDQIKSSIVDNLLNLNEEFIICISCENIQKDISKKKIKDLIAKLPSELKEHYSLLIKYIDQEQTSASYVSFSIFIQEITDEKNEKKALLNLKKRTSQIKDILEKLNISIVKETLNLQPLFFSLFPNRNNLNARKRLLTTENLSSIVTFANQPQGFITNEWGNEPITMFKNINGTPYFFNLHGTDELNKPKGHTMIIGGSGQGKTTLAQFIMLNAMKYDINIFAFDKANGMNVFCEFVNGEYNDTKKNNSFKLNPFSLLEIDNKANKDFLVDFLFLMAGFDPAEINLKPELMQFKNSIDKTLQNLLEAIKINKKLIPTLSEFYKAINEDYKPYYEIYLNGLFDNKEDTLNFEKKLSILNLTDIINNPKISGLLAYYVFYKIFIILGKGKKKGFLFFCDEFRDFASHKQICNSIIRMILELRKLGGIVMLGLQDLSFLKGLDNENSFYENMENFIVYPVESLKNLEYLSEKLELTDNETSFLSREREQNQREVLFKKRTKQQTAYLNVSLKPLGDYLKIFTSDTHAVNFVEKIKLISQEYWKILFLNSTLEDWHKPIVKINKEQEEILKKYENDNQEYNINERIKRAKEYYKLFLDNEEEINKFNAKPDIDTKAFHKVIFNLETQTQNNQNIQVEKFNEEEIENLKDFIEDKNIKNEENTETIKDLQNKEIQNIKENMNQNIFFEENDQENIKQIKDKNENN